MIVPLAMSSAGWAAMSAVGGALVGATAGGMIDWLVKSRQEANLARNGARLVAADLRESDSQIRHVEQERRWEMQKLSSPSWLEYRAVLAGRLDGKDFEVVSETVILFEGLDEAMLSAADPSFKSDVDADVLPRLAYVRGEMAKSYNALAALGELDRVGDRIN